MGEAQLRPPEPVYLSIFSDGVRLHNLKFCKWEEKVCQSMLNDILDGEPHRLLEVFFRRQSSCLKRESRPLATRPCAGYFPSALKHEFPGGVPLRLVDKSGEPFPVGFRAFQGHGKVLSGEASKPNATGGYTLGGAPAVHAPPGMIRGMQDLHGAKPAHQTPANFLDKLPQAVIRNGKIIPVREDVANMLQPPRSGLEVRFCEASAGFGSRAAFPGVAGSI
jgi:hypothetical protein